MSQIFPNWADQKTASGCPAMHSCCLAKYGYVGLRFLRYQYSPWLVLAIAPLKMPFASGVARVQEQVRYFRAIARIDFIGVYELLNDLLW